MSDGNSGREVSINSDSTITTTILRENTGGIVPTPAPTPSLADATPATHSLIADATAPDFQLITLMAGEGITITATADNLEIARSAVGYESVTVDVESQTAAPGASEYSLFNGADPQTTGTVSMKKLRTTGATISIADDGEFLDLAAHLTPTGSELSSIIHTPGTGNGNFLPGYTIARGPIAQLKRIAPLSSAVSITTGDPYYAYVDIGVGFEMTNVSSTGDHPVFVNSSDIQIVAKTLTPGTNVTISRPSFEQVEIAGPDETEINRLRAAGAPVDTVSATGTQAIAIGQAAATSGEQSIVIGGSGASVGDYSIAIGVSASTPTDYAIAIGGTAVSRTRSTAVGAGATVALGCQYCVAIGNGTSTSNLESIAFGSRAACTAANTITISDGEGATTNGIADSARFFVNTDPVLELFDDHSVHEGSQWHEYSNILVLQNFSEKGEAPIHPYNLSPNAQLYMPKMRGQDGSPAFEFVSDLNDSSTYTAMAGMGAAAAGAIGAAAGSAIAGGVGVGFLALGGVAFLGPMFISAASYAGVTASVTSVVVVGFPPVALFVGALLVIVAAVVVTAIITAIVAAAIVNWASDLWLQNHSVDWKFQLPPVWLHYAVQMGIESEADMADAAWTFEVINKAGQYGKLIFKIEDEAYEKGYAFVEQRDGGTVQSWTNDSGEKQTIGISFVPHATWGYQVRYTVLTGAEGG